jgi:hypothetical protein
MHPPQCRVASHTGPVPSVPSGSVIVIVIPTGSKGLHNKLAIKRNRVTLLNSRFKLVKFLFS